MTEITLTEAERWQVRAMAADIRALELQLALARELEATALAGMRDAHGGDPAHQWRTSADGARLEVVP